MRTRHEVVAELSDMLRLRDGIVRELRANAGRTTLERYKLYIDVQDKIMTLSEELRVMRKAEQGRGDDT